MLIKEFIRAALIEIAEGVKSTSKELKNKHDSNCDPVKDTSVEFDMGVTVTETKTNEGRGSLNLSIVSLGGAGSQAVENSTVSRVKFKVTLRMH